MSSTFDVSTVTNSIAALSISGVTVRDVDEVVESVGLGTAVLSPRPDDFITNISVVADELTKQLLRVEYDLNYRYFHCAIGGGLGGIFGPYNALITNIGRIIVAFSNDATLTGAMDGGAPTITNIGPVQDNSGNSYHGCEITIHIMQFLEV